MDAFLTFECVDILLLCEVGREPPAAPAGYSVLSFSRGQHSQSNVGGGRGQGLCVVARSSLCAYLRVVRMTQHAVWVRVALPSTAVMHLCLCYVPPLSSANWRRHSAHSPCRAMCALRDDVLAFREFGEVLLMGDFNAHTRDLCDTSEAVRALCDMHGIDGSDAQCSNLPTRANSDTSAPCVLGRALVERVCVEGGCVILNGRSRQDPEGEYTFSTDRAGRVLRSCVDYAICSASLFGRVREFCVLPSLPLSDHRPLFCCLSLLPAAPVPGRPDAVPARLKWDASKREVYAHRLFDSDLVGVLSELAAGLDERQVTVSEGTTKLQSVLHGVATKVFGTVTSTTASGRKCKSWFTHCRAEWRQLQAALGSNDRALVRQCRRAFNTVSRRWKRRLANEFAVKLVNAARLNPRGFWRYVKGQQQQPIPFSLQDLTEYWRRVLGPPACGHLPDLYGSVEELVASMGGRSASYSEEHRQAAAELNVPFTESEVAACLSMLRRGAAPGTDGMYGELFSECWVDQESGGKTDRVYALSGVLCSLFNAALLHNDVPEAWSAACIASVHKKGSTTDPDNYRAIAVGPVVGKVFCMLLNQRLSTFADACGARAAAQAGFRADYSTTDQVFVLHHLIDKHRLGFGSAKGKLLYACFVDFKKAYDSVQRQLLFECLADLGVHGHFLAAVARLYWHSPLHVKLHGQLGEAFHSTCGVRQGDPLSPLLFSLFIDRFEQFVQHRCPGVGVHLWGTLVQVLLYADDLVLLSESPQGLQQLLDVLQEFCQQYNMAVNVPKSEIVVFGKCKWQGTGQWLYDGAPLKVVESFRYLGIQLHCTRGVLAGVEALKGAAGRAVGLLLHRCRQRRVLDVRLRHQLFKSCVLPILCYCCQVWSPFVLSSVKGVRHAVLHSALQTVHTHFLRYLGQFPQGTPTDVLCLELGAHPLATHWLKMLARFWNRLVALPSCRLVKRAFLENLEMGVGGGRIKVWSRAVVECMSQFVPGAPVVKQRQGGGVSPYPLQVHMVVDGVRQVLIAGFEGLYLNPRSRDVAHRPHVTYRAWFWPTNPAREPPLHMLYQHKLPPRLVLEMTRFRGGAHWLAVHQGRHDHVAFVDRTCPKCGSGVEDAHHVLFECPLYASARDRYPVLFQKATLAGIGPGTYHVTAVRDFMQQDPYLVARFVALCRSLHFHAAPGSASVGEATPRGIEVPLDSDSGSELMDDWFFVPDSPLRAVIGGAVVDDLDSLGGSSPGNDTPCPTPTGELRIELDDFSSDSC